MAESVSARFERVSHLTFEFASTIGEITYLRLFDAEAKERLVIGAFEEFGLLWPGTYARLCMDADEAAEKFSLTGSEIRAFREEAQSDSPIHIEVHDKESRKIILAHVRKTIDDLGTAYKRLSAFIAKNYSVWELFGIRGRIRPPAKDKA